MNYQKLYDSIITTAQRRELPTDVYTEKHHIIPQSMGGSNDASNLVKLTAKEHFVAHHLLWKIYRNGKMSNAFMLMCAVKRDGVKYKINAKSYQSLREDNSKFKSEAMMGGVSPNKGKKITEETRLKMSESQKGHGRGNGGSAGFTGKHWSQEQKAVMSERMTGNKNRVGLTHSKDTKATMRANRLGKTKVAWTEERKAARRELLAAKKLESEKSPK